MKIYVLMLIFMMWFDVPHLQSQELLLNQNRYTPNMLNPAAVGLMRSLNVSSFYQNIKFNSGGQQENDHNFGVNLDAPILAKEKYVISAGYRYYGNVGDFIISNGGHLLSTSFSKIVVEDDITHRFSIGLEGGINIKYINENNLRWPVLIGPNGFDPSMPSGEFIPDEINLDFNAGALYHFSLKNRSSFALGYSLYHLNRPSIRLFGIKEDIRINFYLGGTYRFHPKFELLPLVVYVKYGDTEIYNLSLGSKYYMLPKSWVCLDLGYIKYKSSYAGVSVGNETFTVFGNYNFGNSLFCSTLDMGLRYHLGISKI